MNGESILSQVASRVMQNKGLEDRFPPYIVERSADAKTTRWVSVARLGSLKTPRIVGIVLNGRTAVYFSREDLSAGLVGGQRDGIVGYTPESATDIVRNVVLMAAKSP